MIKYFVIITASIFLLWACNKAEQKSDTAEVHNHDTEMTHQHNTDDAHNHSEEDNSPLTLDNGKKWKVNDEMRPFVLQGEEIVGKFYDLKDTNYAALAVDIKRLDDELIKSCTMDGKSHDELHKWLNPHLELVDDLSKASTASNGSAIVAKLKDSYKKYHQYFQ
ncbi:MAG TPA: hypothetical protein PLE30_01935 [Candidatus Kapabacteria bacterium]|nr:hypothetical protein [Candidatus Kapabacteria bacterium]